MKPDTFPGWVPMMETMYRGTDDHSLSLMHALSAAEMTRRLLDKPAVQVPKVKRRASYTRRNKAYWQARSNGKGNSRKKRKIA